MRRRYTYLLPASLQAQAVRADGETVAVNEQFTWNHYLLEVLATGVNGGARRGGGGGPASFVSEWCTPVVQGYFGSRSLFVAAGDGGRRHLRATLIARRSRHFAGTRFLRRGVNADGHVANEVCGCACACCVDRCARAGALARRVSRLAFDSDAI